MVEDNTYGGAHPVQIEKNGNFSHQHTHFGHDKVFVVNTIINKLYLLEWSWWFSISIQKSIMLLFACLYSQNNGNDNSNNNKNSRSSSCRNRKTLFKMMSTKCVLKHHESVTDFSCACLTTFPLLYPADRFSTHSKVTCEFATKLWSWSHHIIRCTQRCTTRLFAGAMEWKIHTIHPAPWISKWLSFVIEFIKIDSVLMKICGKSCSPCVPSFVVRSVIFHYAVHSFVQVAKRKVFRFKIHFECVFFSISLDECMVHEQLRIELHYAFRMQCIIAWIKYNNKCNFGTLHHLLSRCACVCVESSIQLVLISVQYYKWNFCFVVQFLY